MDVGMGLSQPSKDGSWFFYIPAALLGTKTLEHADGWPPLVLVLLTAFLSTVLAAWWFSPGGAGWANGRNARGAIPIPGLRGLPVIGSLYALSRGMAHLELGAAADSLGARQLMAFSLGSTPAVVASDPGIAREILTSPSFADRPLKQSARLLLFERAIGFAPNGAYWKLLRRIATSHLFAPRRIAAHEPGRQLDAAAMLGAIAAEQRAGGFVALRRHLQGAALNSIMGSVFGRRYDVVSEDREVTELKEMVAEGFELLGAFNWSDYLTWLGCIYDPHRVQARCVALVPRVHNFVSAIIHQHRERAAGHPTPSSSIPYAGDGADFVDVLLSLEGGEKLQENDMIAILWEMIFRGTDTTALLTEWVMAELVLNTQVQAKLQAEIDDVVGRHRGVTDADVARLPYLQAVVKEGLRLHPPGPLLSWARLSTADVQLSNGMIVPANTTAMVNMWAITHDPGIWADARSFKPERFFVETVDVRGSDLRLAPFGSGRRVCPGKGLGLATVSLWVAKLVQHFKWVQAHGKEVDLTEVLKLSCEMKYPLCAEVVSRGVS